MTPDCNNDVARCHSLQRVLGGVGCACVHTDGQTCARIRDGYEPDDRNYEMRKRTCECACHSEGDEDEYD